MPFKLMRIPAGLFAVVLAMFVLGGPRVAESAPHGAATLIVADQVEVDHPQVRLGHLARVSGPDPALVAALEAIEIGRAPLAGNTRTVSRDYLLLRLRQNGYEPAVLVIRAPERVTVVRRSVTMTAADIEMMVRDYVTANPPYGGADMTITAIRVPGDVVLPTGDVRHEIQYMPGEGGSGTLPVNVLFSAGGEIAKRILVTVQVAVLKEVPVTRHPIARYQMIQPEDLMPQTIDVAGLPSNTVLAYEDIEGQRARRSIGAQRVLRTDLFEFPPAVKRGDRVLIVAESGALRITAIGEVQSTGRIGERVRVVNLDSNKILYARVIDARTVRVQF